MRSSTCRGGTVGRGEREKSMDPREAGARYDVLCGNGLLLRVGESATTRAAPEWAGRKARMARLALDHVIVRPGPREKGDAQAGFPRRSPAASRHAKTSPCCNTTRSAASSMSMPLAAGRKNR